MPGISFSGLASGIDGDAVIQATMESRRLAALPLENTKVLNQAESEALDELNTKLLTLSDSMREFKTTSGGAISKTATSSNSDVLSVSAGTNAPSTSTTITVSQVARSATLSFDQRFSSIEELVAPELSEPKTLRFTIGQGDETETVEVTVDGSMSLEDLADRIGTAGDGLLRPSIVNAGTDSSPSYILMVNTLDSGVEKGNLELDVPAELTQLSSYNTEQAQNAIVSMPGIGEVTRSSNTISDLIPGVTLELRQASIGSVTVQVENDYSKTADRVEKFIEQINDIISYQRDNNVIEQREDEDGNNTNVYQSLAKSRVDDQVISDLRSAISGAQSSQESTRVRGMVDLGISVNRDGTYSFDREKFVSNAAKEPGASFEILQKFGDSLGSTRGVIDRYTKFDGQIKIALDANESEDSRIDEKLERLERMLAQQEQTLKRMFVNLETKISELNAGADSLFSLLSSGIK